MNPCKLMRRIMKKMARHYSAALGLILFVLLGSCKTNTEDNDTSNTFLRIVSLQGAEGDDVFSDACIQSETNVNVCSVVNDNGVVTLEAFPKDLTQPTTVMNDIIIERYRVTYVRADGRNVPGTDVPYPFDGVANFRVPFDGGAISRTFMVVRHQAKLEPPLAQLANVGGALVLSTLAQIDFYGRDVAGRAIQVTGYLNITFADFP